MDTRELHKQATREAIYFVVCVIVLVAVVMLTNGCSLLTSEQKEQVKDAAKEQVNKPENQEKVIEQINEVLK